MDFLTALLEPQFSETSALKPRVPALFEPIAPRVDFAPFQESADEILNQAARDEIPTRATLPYPARNFSREREPYRGVLNVPPSHDATDAPISPASQNTAPRDTQSSIEQAAQLPTPRVEQETRATSEPPIAMPDDSRIEILPPIPALYPAQAFEPRPLEPRIETVSDAAPNAAPIVRVNIGRIVVRAVSENSPAPLKRESKSKKMSLDEYLKKRERGER